MNTAYESDGLIYVPQTTYLRTLEKKKLKEKKSKELQRGGISTVPTEINNLLLPTQDLPLSPSEQLKKIIPKSIRKNLLPEMIDIWHETTELLGYSAKDLTFKEALKIKKHLEVEFKKKQERGVVGFDHFKAMVRKYIFINILYIFNLYLYILLE